MKTPRDILLKRYQDAAPKLDAIRREVVEVAADVNRRKQPVRELIFAAALANAIKVLFQELVWPCRRTWAGLAARKLPPPSPEAILAWRQQERLLAELIGPSVPGDADRRKIFLPKPRTENTEFLAA